METLTYEELKEFENKINKKLFSYINSNPRIINALDQLDIQHPFFLEDDNKLAFNMWFSTDFKLEDGSTIVECFLRDRSSKLTSREISYLKERSRSHISIYEIIEYEDEYIYLKDLLLNKLYKLWEPDLVHTVDEGELLLTRIAKLVDNYNFIGDISHLPRLAKDDFIEAIILNFNNIRKIQPDLTIKDYLKSYSLNIYNTYNDTILNMMDIKEEMDSLVYDEISEFASYLERKISDLKVKEYANNLINIYEYSLAQDDFSLADLDQLDIVDFINRAIEDEFINSKTSLNSYIKTLKAYLGFLRKKDPAYNKSYSDILYVSKYRFHFMEKIVYNDLFTINRDLLAHVNLNQASLNILDDLESFLIYIGEDSLALTKQNKHIKRKDLKELNDLLINKPVLDKKAPNQGDFPAIHFFYNLTLNYGLTYIDSYNEFLMDSYAIDFLKLSDEERYLLLFQYLWSKDFITDFDLGVDEAVLTKGKNVFMDLINFSRPNERYSLASLGPLALNMLLVYGKYLDLLGLIIFDFNKHSNFSLTSLGLKLFKSLSKQIRTSNDSNIIQLDNYRKDK